MNLISYSTFPAGLKNQTIMSGGPHEKSIRCMFRFLKEAQYYCKWRMKMKKMTTKGAGSWDLTWKLDDMWPVTSHVYERATEPGLPACTICTKPNGSKHQILYFMEIGPLILINFWYDERGHISKLSFIVLGFYVEIMTQNVNFPISHVQYCACKNTQRMYKVTQPPWSHLL